MKISIIGMGAVGTSCADNILRENLCKELVILDIKSNIIQGKKLDFIQASSLLNFNTKLIASNNDYSLTKNSHIVIITSGFPRTPGMTREELINVNSKIVSQVTKNIIKYSYHPIFIVVVNPLDSMTYLVLKTTNFPINKIIGMGGALDSARFKFYIAQELQQANQNDIEAYVIGGHGDKTMIPLIRLAKWNNVFISTLLNDQTKKKIISNTMQGGATITKLLGNSAYYTPGAAVMTIIKSIIKNDKKIIPCSIYLQGEYAEQHDICLGVPVTLGINGWEKIIDLKLNQEEIFYFTQSAHSIKNMNNLLRY